ncbi:MAG TPA: hypothetical protein DEB10_08280 [Ruminococcaceae bacterium]|jgi:hypothetical protein|nr:hypothetical protein [Oscillospiraceae bacterium]
MDSMIGRTLPEAGLDTIFKEVDHHETLGTRYPEQLRLFHLQVSNNKFIFTSLENYLTGIISEYVFSRAQMERLTDPKSSINPRSIGIKALRVMKKNGAADQKGTGNELGEILLYAFLEDVLGAPKLFSKVELNAASTPFGKESDSIHLLSLGDESGTTIYETVFGTSDIDGEIENAIDKAFDTIERIENENGEGISLVANQAFEESFDPDVIPRVKNAIVPGPGTPIVSDRAYGVFLGYSLGLDPSTRSTVEFLRDMDRKMEADIRQHANYITEKIKRLRLETRSFYFYIVPFNDAEVDKKQVMEDLLM